jgi:uncharacterized LabA/DUF88 family protein
MDRCAIFIDGAYVEKIFKNHLGGAKIDYGKAAQKISSGCDLLRTYYYNCPPYQSNPPTQEERQRYSGHEKFVLALARLPRFQVRLGKLEFRGTRADGSRIFAQKRVDILLGVDMVELAATRQITRAVLVAGDSDFLPAIEAVKRQGVMTVLWHGPRGGQGRPGTYHNDLWDTCDERFEMDAAFATAVTR